MKSRPAAFVICLACCFCGCGRTAPDRAKAPTDNPAGSSVARDGDINSGPATSLTGQAALADEDRRPLDTAPGLDQRQFVSVLEDAYRRIDPAADGWQTEAFSQAADQQLQRLKHLLESAASVSAADLAGLFAADAACDLLLQDSPTRVFQDKVVVVDRHSADRGAVAPQAQRGLASAARNIHGLIAHFDVNSVRRVKFKLYRVRPKSDLVETDVLFHIFGRASQRPCEITAHWNCDWAAHAETAPADRPLIRRVAVDSYERVQLPSSSDAIFADSTASLLGGNPVYTEQLLRSTDDWRIRLCRGFGLDVVANHGLAIGDVNGDLLDDVYLCQQGGLPNRLFVQNADGTLRDESAASGADWLDYCASALLIDLDNDGDCDLVVGQESTLLLMDNNGQGRFELKHGFPMPSQTFSLAANDYDRDGDLDIYVCGYNPSDADFRAAVMGEPMPYHDANNGGPNTLLRNEGSWQFSDATQQSGLRENNTRFSFAASWEDFDNDGDADLYVANDYGRNNLYLNTNGYFRDVAGQLGVEDMSSGMSVSWSDFNHDGRMDLYVSNMFSAAGNRITYQRQFKNSTQREIREQFQRHARGNSLFLNRGPDKPFEDISETAGVTIGRWAWGARFADINNDSWDDLIVANGFITTADTGDL